jgi:archaellin
MKEDLMKFCRTTGFIVLSLFTAFFLAACGGGGGGDAPAPDLRPTATTTAATNQSSTGATLNGSVNPKGLATTAWFEYSKDPALATNVTATTAQSVGSGSVTIDNVTVTLSGLDPGTTYSYRVVAHNSEGTTQGSIYTFSTLPLPTATTSAATPITTTGATLNATVNPNGRSTYAWFEYGLTSSLGTVVDNQLRGSGSDNVSISFPLSPLSVATQYYFRIVANNSAGTTTGTTLSFVTAGGTASVTTKDASLVTASGATLNADVNPSGLATYSWFQYGPTTSFGSILDNASRGSGTSTVPVASPLTGLSEHTQYYYRVEANNTVGTSFGGTLNFTTGCNSPPSAIAHYNETVYTMGPGSDNTAPGATEVTLDGSGSSGTITDYLWDQIAGTNSVTISNATNNIATFIAPTFDYGVADNMVFRLTVTDSARPVCGIGTDNIWKNVKWGYFDDFHVNSTAAYERFNSVNSGGTFTYDAGNGGRARVVAGDNTGIKFQKTLTSASKLIQNTAVFSVDFTPTAQVGTGSISIRLGDGDAYLELSTADEKVRKVWPLTPVDEAAFAFPYVQGTTYHITISYSPISTTFTATGGGITVGPVELNTNSNTLSPYVIGIDSFQQSSYFDNIKLEAAP